jgi:tetratricopeptide (TPR) repeat protein
VSDERKAAVSLCMIVRNEARNLSECLPPVASLFDDIVIVDTGSHDETMQVAGRFTERVFSFPWNDDFSAARNESLRHARGDWVFWLDADDRITGPNLQQLRRLFQVLPDQPEMHFMDTVLSPKENGGNASLVTHPRLFRRLPGVRWQGRVHEHLDLDHCPVTYECRFSDVRIEHTGYRDPTLRRRKLHRNLRLLNMEHAVDPTNANTLWHLGTTHLGLGNVGTAYQHLSSLLDGRPLPAELLRSACAVLAGVWLHQGNAVESLRLAEHGLSMIPADEHLLYAQALALYELKEFAAAERILTKLMSGSSLRQFHFGAAADLSSKLAPHLLGTIRYLQHRYRDAESAFREVLARFPGHVDSWYSLGLVYIATRNQPELDLVTASLDRCDGGSVDSRTLGARWCMSRGNLAAAGEIIDRLIGDAPDSSCLRLLRAEWLSRCRASGDSQIRALRDVLRLEPGNMAARKCLVTLESAQPTAVPAMEMGPVGSWASAAACSSIDGMAGPMSV